MRDEDVTDKEAQHSLHIRHVDTAYHARYGNEGYTRKRRTYHSDGNDIPGRLSVSQEKGFVTAVPPGQPGDEQQKSEVKGNNQKYQVTVHCQ